MARKWIYPRRMNGAFFRWRRGVAAALIVVYTALPHLEVRGLPAVLLDIPARRFILFGVQFGATDTLLLALLGLSIVIGILALTALLGRVWCGWGCPQTVYLEFVFRPIERWIEGQGDAQQKFDAAPWTADKLGRKALKWSLFLLVAMVLSHTFVAYFTGVDRLMASMSRSPAEHPLSFLTMAGVTGAILFDFAWFREQMCTIACPYARLQSVMMDTSTLRVGYDAGRGEPRGKAKRGASDRGGAPRGDCVDCGLCMQTCPNGIDIRDGFQLECIGCTQCIDACDSVMSRLDRPTGLIRHTSVAELEGRRTDWHRPRIIAYLVLLLVLVSTLSYRLANRSEAEVTVLRAVGEPYQALPEGRVSNHLKLRAANQSLKPDAYTFTLTEPAGGQLIVASAPLPVGPGEMATTEAFVVLPAATLHAGRSMLSFQVKGEHGFEQQVRFTFVGPTGP